MEAGTGAGEGPLHQQPDAWPGPRRSRQLDRTPPVHRTAGAEPSARTGRFIFPAIGLYGVISYSVAQRTFEIGVRAALGADTTRVLSMVLRHGMVLVACGLGLGIVGAFFVTRLLSGLLHGVTPTDPVSFAGMSLVLIAVAFLASVIPARRAARIDPMIALRTE